MCVCVLLWWLSDAGFQSNTNWDNDDELFGEAGEEKTLNEYEIVKYVCCGLVPLRGGVLTVLARVARRSMMMRSRTLTSTRRLTKS